MSSSVSSTISSTYVNGRQLISGLSSGIDVDSIVQKTITADKWKLYKLQQSEQLTEWRQTAYREIISDVKTFSDTYFNVTSSSSLLSTKNFQKFAVTNTNESAVTATAGTTASTGTHKLTVSQLATAASLTGSSTLAKEVQGTTAADFALALGQSFIIDLDGTEKTITIDDAVTNVATLQVAIDAAVGENKIAVTTDADTGALMLKAADSSGVQKVTISSPDDSSTSALSSLGFGDDAILSNRISTSDTLDTIASQLNTTLTFDDYGQVAMTINGVDFTFDKSATLSEVMTEINQSSAGATIKYDELAGKLVLTADDTGAGSTLAVSETGSNFLSVALDQPSAGQDAKLTLDDVALTRSSNTIAVDGVTYTLNDTTADAVTVGITQDTDGIYDTIANFVDAYNSLIDTINGKLAEEYDSDYPPLTDDQKADMSDSEITNWEEKAKTGILANDSLMQNLVDNMRSALMETVSGQSANLTKIGITTSTYDEKGKLHIDEATLKQAIQTDPEAITELFTQQSTSYSGTTTVRTLDSSARKVRYKEEGIAYRLYDILQDNISTLRDSSDNKGLMLEKAGLEDDTTETDNSYTTALKDYQEKIEAEEDRLDEEEENLYEKYSTLETYISTMSAQLSAISSLTSS
jgi:flagellar hook-associated protein 2